jgi:hypothetical protein
VETDGATLRKHLESVEAQTGKRPAQLDGPEFPTGVEYLWEWYWQLRRHNGGNGFGPGPISWSEIDAWARRTGADPAPWELEVISELDAAYLKQQAVERKKNDDRHRNARDQG